MADADAHTNTDPMADADAHTDENALQDPHPDADQDAHAYDHRDAVANRSSHQHANTFGDVYRCSYAAADAHGDARSLAAAGQAYRPSGPMK